VKGALSCFSVVYLFHVDGTSCRALQLDKLLLTLDEEHIKMNNFEMAKQFSPFLGCDSSQAWKVSHSDDGDPDERSTNRGPASPKVPCVPCMCVYVCMFTWVTKILASS
jgi:hypothetical protein